MAVEIERKFLLLNDDWHKQIVSSSRMRQGYLASVEGLNSIRVRIDGDKANLNLKSGRTSITRDEFEYTIPLEDANEMLDKLVSGPVIDKTRHIVHFAGLKWEVDEFAGDNAGLVIAEVELASEDQVFDRPPWVGEEVSDDPRYYNVNLVKHPYKDW